MNKKVEELLADPGKEGAQQYGEISLNEVRRLHRDTVLAMLKKESGLSGAEVRFLRERMSFSRQKVAASVGISRELVESWEKDSATIIPAIDVRLRLLCAEHIGVILDVRNVLCALVRQSRRDTELQRTSRTTRQAPRATARMEG